MMRRAAFNLAALVASVLAVDAQQQPASRADTEQRALAEAIRTLPAAEGQSVESRLKGFKIDLNRVIRQQLVLSPAQDFRVQREVEDRLKPVPITNNQLRPVFPQTPFSLYSDLTRQESDTLAERVRSIGRIETRAGTSVALEGTGFVVSRNVIATNCHVVSAIAEPAGNEWRLRSETMIDFSDDDQHRGSAEYRITGVGSHSTLRGLDVAVLTVESSSVDRSHVLPGPLPVARTRFIQEGDPTLVGVVGYPDLARATEPVFRQLRGRTASTKVYSPGAVLSVEVLGSVDVLFHVANTMKGSSGSPVLSRGQLEVVAVHNCCTAGTPAAAAGLPCADVLVNRPFRNGAISVWSLAADSVMAPFFSSVEQRPN